MLKNRYKVPRSQWRKWSPEARAIFNGLYSAFRDYDMYKHPKAPLLKIAHWTTVRWNAAWTAASLHDEVTGHGFTSLAHPGGR